MGVAVGAKVGAGDGAVVGAVVGCTMLPMHVFVFVMYLHPAQRKHILSPHGSPLHIALSRPSHLPAAMIRFGHGDVDCLSPVLALRWPSLGAVSIHASGC